MEERLDYFDVSPESAKKYLEFNNALKARSVVRELNDLVTIRASQLNGCGFCLDMHVKSAKIRGERELRLHHIAAWRDSPLFTERERVALAWTEALTNLPPHGIPDELYEHVRAQFNEEEIAELSFLVVAINGWNRLNVAFRLMPGSRDASFGLDKADLR